MKEEKYYRIRKEHAIRAGLNEMLRTADGDDLLLSEKDLKNITLAPDEIAQALGGELFLKDEKPVVIEDPEVPSDLLPVDEPEPPVEDLEVPSDLPPVNEPEASIEDPEVPEGLPNVEDPVVEDPVAEDPVVEDPVVENVEPEITEE